MNDIAPDRPSDDDNRTRITSRPDVPGDDALGGVSTPHEDDDVTLLPAGSRLAEFEIKALIGQGGFGTVYEALDHALERTVAIKEYLPVSLSTRQPNGTVRPLSKNHRETFELGMNSFINEARLLAQFDHPSLLKVHRFWQERGTAYMVMPYYRGQTLRQALATMPDRPSEDFLLSIIDELTQAVAVMHRANCYHRDIAPDNIILLEGSNRPVLLDFGAARRVITHKTQAITAILKPGYAPIEQYAETPDMRQGAWTDVYALAAVLHVAITGHTPPPSVARLLADSYTPVALDAQLQKQFSPRLLAAIDVGLAVRPEARPQSVEAFRTLLGLSESAMTTIRHAGLAPSPTSKKSVTPPPSGKKSNMPRVAIAAVSALLVLTAGLIWWGGEESPKSDAPQDRAVAETGVLSPPALPAGESVPEPASQTTDALQSPPPILPTAEPVPEPAKQTADALQSPPRTPPAKESAPKPARQTANTLQSPPRTPPAKESAPKPATQVANTPQSPPPTPAEPLTTPAQDAAGDVDVKPPPVSSYAGGNGRQDTQRSVAEQRADAKQRAAAERREIAEQRAAAKQRAVAERREAAEQRTAAKQRAAAERREAAEQRAAAKQREAAERRAQQDQGQREPTFQNLLP